MLTDMQCSGCGRKPTLWEWIRAEMSQSGYEEWRHPGITFTPAGCPFTPNNRDQCERLFEDVFQRPLPYEACHLCPGCQNRVNAELPELLARDIANEGERQRQREARRREQRQEYLGVQRPWD